MTLVTQRLVLREFTGADLPGLRAYHCDPRYTEFSGPEARPPDELLRSFRRWGAAHPRRNHQLAVVSRVEPAELLGSCGLRGEGSGRAEFGIELAPASWGRGYATEAARALLAFGFCELALEEIRGRSVSANVRIASLCRRLGMMMVGTRPGPAWMQTRGWSQIEWRVTRASFEASKALP
jgi:RimJ/RimL family protein N-acetyltransferase